MSKLLKTITLTFVIIVTFAVGMHIGRVNTIHQAELIETQSDYYFISFGDEVHEYTFEEE